MKNIILIGMPGTGKSVVGRALADRLHYTFVDMDDLIGQAAGQTLAEILRSRGLEAFLTLEGQIGEALTCENTVIATDNNTTHKILSKFFFIVHPTFVYKNYITAKRNCHKIL